MSKAKYLKTMTTRQILNFLYRKVRGRSTVLRYQKKQLRKLLHHTWDHSRFYRNYYLDHGVRKSDLAEIPFDHLPCVDKTILMDNLDDVMTDKRLRSAEILDWLSKKPDPHNLYLDKFVVMNTSGSSGRRACYVYTLSEMSRHLACFSTQLLAPRLPRKNKVYYGYYFVGGMPYCSVMLATLTQLMGYNSVFCTTENPVAEVVSSLNKVTPPRIVCYASALVELVAQAQAGNLKISPKVIISTGDALTVELSQQVNDLWGIYPIDLYSSTEVPFIAARHTPYDDFQIYDDNVKLEILYKETKRPVLPGEDGDVFVTNLHNFTTPVIRYQLGDHACLNQLSKVNNGRYMRGSTGSACELLPVVSENGALEYIYAQALVYFSIKGVKRFQFISESPRRVLIQYISDADYDGLIKRQFNAILEKKKALQSVAVSTQRVAVIKPNNNGKTPLVRIIATDQ